MNKRQDDEYLKAWVNSRTLGQRLDDVKEAIWQAQHGVLCSLFRYPNLSNRVTPHLFAGSPASVCIVKAIKGGARGLLGITKSAAKIAGVPLLRFPLLETVDVALGFAGSRAGAEGRITVLKYWVSELARLEKMNRRRLVS